MKRSGGVLSGSYPPKLAILGLLAVALFLSGQTAQGQATRPTLMDLGALPVNAHYSFEDKYLVESPFENQAAQSQNQTPAQPTGTGATQAGAVQSTSTPSSQPKQKKAAPEGTSNDRLFYVLPNFLTLEESEQVPPLTAKQKFAVTARGIYDPAEFALTGIVALLGQASNSDPSYGQGMQGYAKRYATTYGDNVIENFMASAIFPSILHQDPRYFQLGHGGAKKRIWHAFTRAFVTRSDSGAHQFNFSEIGGALAAAGISTYTYHPQSDRGFSEVITVWGTQVGWDVGTYVLKEFWPDLRNKYSKHHNNAETTIDAPVPTTTVAPTTAAGSTPAPK
ncbi:MAG: hypothetical protein WA823_01530 [Candidatus Acidiferrales bacterium]